VCDANLITFIEAKEPVDTGKNSVSDKIYNSTQNGTNLYMFPVLLSDLDCMCMIHYDEFAIEF